MNHFPDLGSKAKRPDILETIGDIQAVALVVLVMFDAPRSLLVAVAIAHLLIQAIEIVRFFRRQ